MIQIELRKLIADGKSDKVIERLLIITIPDHDLHNEMLQISGQFNKLERQSRLSITDPKLLSVERNRIDDTLLKIIDRLSFLEMESDNVLSNVKIEAAPKIDSPTNIHYPPIFIFLGILLLVTLIYLFSRQQQSENSEKSTENTLILGQKDSSGQNVQKKKDQPPIATARTNMTSPVLNITGINSQKIKQLIEEIAGKNQHKNRMDIEITHNGAFTIKGEDLVEFSGGYIIVIVNGIQCRKFEHPEFQLRGGILYDRDRAKEKVQNEINRKIQENISIFSNLISLCLS